MEVYIKWVGMIKAGVHILAACVGVVGMLFTYLGGLIGLGLSIVTYHGSVLHFLGVFVGATALSIMLGLALLFLATSLLEINSK